MKNLIFALLLLSTTAYAQQKELGLPEQVAPKDRIAFAMYTVHDNTVKMLAQFYPIKNYDPTYAFLQIKENGEWVQKDSAEIIYPGYTCHFRIDNWDDTKAYEYRVAYNTDSPHKNHDAYYEGIIQKNPRDKDEFVMGVFSCNSIYENHGGNVSRQDIVDNMKAIKADMLFFAGDQVYDHSEHYWHWLRFGQDFGELLRNIPTVTIPDDHDIGQANLWGESGRKGTGRDGWNGGYVMPVEYVKEVERAQCGHLPDPYDPTPIEQGIGVYYTALTWGGISFAIIEDRKFKSAPGNILNGKMKSNNPLEFDVHGATLLGDRQLKFLEDWSDDWKDAEIKAVLSQTIFASLNTASGTKKNVMHRDYDTNGWPQAGRNKAVAVIRKSYSCMIAGDTHLGSVIHHGIYEYGDAGYSFASPAIASLWMRWWEPEGKANNAIAGIPYTGEYLDGFDNKLDVRAVANPVLDDNIPADDLVNARGAGIGVVRFKKSTREITFECWPRNVDILNPDNKPFAGWPVKFSQFDNYVVKNGFELPTLKIADVDCVVTVKNHYTKELIFSVRINGKEFKPKVENAGDYDILVGEGESIKTYYRVRAEKENRETLKVE